jgi:hypothetical protein
VLKLQPDNTSASKELLRLEAAEKNYRLQSNAMAKRMTKKLFPNSTPKANTTTTNGSKTETESYSTAGEKAANGDASTVAMPDSDSKPSIPASKEHAVKTEISVQEDEKMKPPGDKLAQKPKSGRPQTNSYTMILLFIASCLVIIVSIFVASQAMVSDFYLGSKMNLNPNQDTTTTNMNPSMNSESKPEIPIQKDEKFFDNFI